MYLSHTLFRKCCRIIGIIIWQLVAVAYVHGTDTYDEGKSPGAIVSPVANQAADLDQARNGRFDAPVSPVAWVNGNAGASNSHYAEGYSIPYRMVLTNLTPGAHTLIIEWDIKHSGRNAIDFITSYNALSRTLLNSAILPRS